VRDPDGRVGLVHVLAAGALGAVGVDPEVVLVDLDGAVLRQQRAGDHLREGGVAPVRLVEGAEADEPVLAALGPEDPVRVLAGDGERRGLEAGLLPRARLDHVDLEAAELRPPLVHAQEHLREVLRVGAADVGLQGHDGVAGVVFAGEERLFLEAVELLLERRDRLHDLGLHAAVHRVELACVLVLADELAIAVELALDARVLGRDLRRVLLVVPEAGGAHLLL
jgi:hypothetical protein